MMNIATMVSHLKKAVFSYRLIRLKNPQTHYKELWIPLSNNHRVYAHIHSHVRDGIYPGIIFVPGGISPGTDYDRAKEIIADDVASAGFTVLHYDPSGRGKTGGKENHWGAIHQEELALVVDYFSQLPQVDVNNIGICSFSIGIVIAAGALARFPTKVKYLFDWEGPSNRYVITMNDTFEPFKHFPTSNEDFWKEREAIRFIGDISCGYFRYQSEIDHMQGEFKGHAIELLNLATKGKAQWTRCNENAVNIIFDENRIQEYYWIPERLNTKKQILKYLIEIQSICIK